MMHTIFVYFFQRFAAFVSNHYLRKECWQRWLLHRSFEQHSWHPAWRPCTLLPTIPGDGLLNEHT